MTPRTYGWGKIRENPTRCIIAVGSYIHSSYQCSRKRGYGHDGLYCKQHAKRLKAVALRALKEKP